MKKLSCNEENEYGSQRRKKVELIGQKTRRYIDGVCCKVKTN